MNPGNPQCCNSMIAKQSIRLYFYVSLFTLGVIALVNIPCKYSIRKLPRVNLHVTKLEII